jgi:hypothetical protein
MARQTRTEMVIDQSTKTYTLTITADWVDTSTAFGNEEYPSELGRVMVLDDGRHVEPVGDWARRRYRVVGTGEILLRYEPE